MKLGEVLVARGYLTPEQLSYALARQRRRHGHLGKILVRMNAITIDELHSALRDQREQLITEQRQILERVRATHGAEHPRTIRAHYELARALFDAGQPVDAGSHAKIAYDGFVANESRHDPRARNAAQLVLDAKAAIHTARKNPDQ